MVAVVKALSAAGGRLLAADDRSRLAEVRRCPSLTGTGSSRLDRLAVRRSITDSRPPNKSSGTYRRKFGYNWGSASSCRESYLNLTWTVSKQSTKHRVQSSRKDYRKGDAGSSSNGFSATPTELRPRRITAAATATKHLDRLRCAPLERGRADRNATATAEFRTGGILVPAAWACDSSRGGC